MKWIEFNDDLVNLDNVKTISFGTDDSGYRVLKIVFIDGAFLTKSYKNQTDMMEDWEWLKGQFNVTTEL